MATTPRRTPVLALALALTLCVGVVSGDCPPRAAGVWEHNVLRVLMSGYDKVKAGARCVHVQVALLPRRVVVEEHRLASLAVGVVFEWLDPSLVNRGDGGERIKVNSSEIWMPEITEGPENRLLGARGPADQYAEVDTATGTVTAFYRTTLRGFCEPAADAADAWPHDELVCEFLVMPARPVSYVLDHQHTISEIIAMLQDFRAKLDAESREMERLSAWQQESLDSSLLQGVDSVGAAIVVKARLRRLAGQLRAVAVQPAAAAAALVPASAALPPGADARPALLTLAVTLHAALLLALPRLVDDLGGNAPPRALLLYRDLGLLLALMVLQWLLSLRLASRRKRLPPWGQALARAFAVLRTPLLLPATPALPAPPVVSRLVDEESVGLSEVLDRLTFFAAGAAYLVSVVISLQ